MQARDFMPPLKYGAQIIGTDVYFPEPFIATTASFGSASVNTGTAWIDLLSSGSVGSKTAYVTGFAIQNSGDVNVTGSTFSIMDTNGTKIWDIAAGKIPAGCTVTSSGTMACALISSTMSGGAGLGIGLKNSGGSITGTPTLRMTVWGLLL